jgi:drug/metabolite transporter (DMT)-like permease
MPAAVPIAVPAPPSVAIPKIPKSVLVAAFCLIWSAAFAVGKIAIADCPPLLLVSVRCLIAGAILLGIAALTGARRPAWRDVAALSVLGVATYAAYLGLNYVGVRHGVSAGLSALIISANPVLTALIAAVVLDEALTWRKVVGLSFGVIGVAIIVERRILGGESPLGIAFVIGALVAMVAGTILFKRLAPNGGLWTGNGIQNLAGGVALIPFWATFENLSDVTPTWRLLAALTFLVVMSSIIAYMLWFHLLTVSGASAASAYHFLMPPLGLMFGWLLLSERIEPLDLIGVVPVALGVWLVTHAA